jgi:membrane protein YdbS with pleckstrin-like domain
MNYQKLLDPIPIIGVFALIAAILLVVFEVGYRVGRWRQERTPDEKEGPTGMLVGSLLALMAFLLAVTMGMASDRFDTRRGLVLEEANAIGTTYLRAGCLPQPYGADSQDLLREYVPLRINVADLEQREANFARSTEIHAELWAMAEELARRTPDSVVLGLYIDTLNQTIDLHATRATAIVYARVPETVVLLLVIGAALTMGMVGYNAGLSRRRSFLGAAVLVVVLAAVLTLVVDLDRPRDGFLQVSQQPLIDLQEQIGAPSP